MYGVADLIMVNKKSSPIIISVVVILIGVVFYFASPRQEVDPNNSNQKNTEEILLMVEGRGGLCPYGGCYSKTEIYKNGSYSYQDGARQITGELASNDISNLERLKRLIQKANFIRIKSKKFTGLCPTAYDGQELIYTFYPSGEVIATCTYAVDVNSSLFRAIGDLLKTIYGLIHL